MFQWVLLGLLAMGSKVSEWTAADRATLYYQPLMNQELTPENTVIVFDWHEVVQEQNFGRIGLKLLVKNGLTAYYIFNPVLWAKVRELKSRGLIAEQIVDGVLEVFPKIKPVKAHFIDAVNDEPMIDKTIEVIKALKQAGFRIYMFSNIAPETLEQLWKKQGDVLDLFDGIYRPNKEDGYVQKPKPGAYEAFKKFIAQHGDAGKNLLFIDDRESNIKGGFDAGIPGIVFASTEQLHEILHDLKLLEIGG